MSRSSSRSNRRPTQQPNQADQPSVMSTAVAAGGASALGGGLASAGGATITSCPAEDKSFYCTFVKGFNIFKMVLFILGVVFILYVLYSSAVSNGKSGTGRRR